MRADLCLDAGSSTPENVALLIKMGYKAYIKPHNAWLKACLQQDIDTETSWTQVGHNTGTTARKAMKVKDVPYPLDIAVVC